MQYFVYIMSISTRTLHYTGMTNNLHDELKNTLCINAKGIASSW
jgi:predicted GIY-YIG superfamily endonuclease